MHDPTNVKTMSPLSQQFSNIFMYINTGEIFGKEKVAK
jgi:hypothetical protein